MLLFVLFCFIDFSSISLISISMRTGLSFFVVSLSSCVGCLWQEAAMGLFSIPGFIPGLTASCL